MPDIKRKSARDQLLSQAKKVESAKPVVKNTGNARQQIFSQANKAEQKKVRDFDSYMTDVGKVNQSTSQSDIDRLNERRKSFGNGSMFTGVTNPSQIGDLIARTKATLQKPVIEDKAGYEKTQRQHAMDAGNWDEYRYWDEVIRRRNSDNSLGLYPSEYYDPNAAYREAAKSGAYDWENTGIRDINTAKAAEELLYNAYTQNTNDPYSPVATSDTIRAALDAAEKDLEQRLPELNEKSFAEMDSEGENYWEQERIRAYQNVEDLRQRLKEAENNERLNGNILDKYSDIINADDFEKYSRYVPQDSDGGKGYGLSTMGYEFVNPENRSMGYTSMQALGPEFAEENKRWAFLTEDEAKIYNYIYATQGYQAAEDFLNDPDLNSLLTARENAWTSEYWKEFGKENPVVGTLGSFESNMRNMVAAPVSLAGAISDAITGRNDNSDLFDYSRKTNALRSGAQENMGTAGNIAYGAATSLVDMGMAIWAGGTLAGENAELAQKLTAGIMSSSAGASTYADNIDNGKEPWEALTRASLSASIEWLTEDWSLEQLFSNPKSTAKFLLKNFVAEGSEEGASDIANTFVDELISHFTDSKSEIEQARDAYVSEGYSAKEAMKKALEDKGMELFTDVAAGALSGGIAAGARVPTVSNNIRASNAVVDFGKAFGIEAPFTAGDLASGEANQEAVSTYYDRITRAAYQQAGQKGLSPEAAALQLYSIGIEADESIAEQAYAEGVARRGSEPLASEQTQTEQSAATTDTSKTTTSHAASQSVAQVSDYESMFGNEGKKALRENATSGTSAREYSLAMAQAYNRGRQSVTGETSANVTTADNVLTSEQRLAAYRAGVRDAQKTAKMSTGTSGTQYTPAQTEALSRLSDDVLNEADTYYDDFTQDDLGVSSSEWRSLESSGLVSGGVISSTVIQDEINRRNYKEENNGGNLSVRQGSERNDSQNPEVEVRGVEEGARGDQNWQSKRKAFGRAIRKAVSEASSIRSQTTASQGIKDGTNTASVKILTNSIIKKHASLKEAVDKIKSLVKGDVYLFTGELELYKTDSNGKYILDSNGKREIQNPRALVTYDKKGRPRIFVKADDMDADAMQLGLHEAFHVMANPALLKTLRNQIKVKYTDAELRSISEAYASAYYGAGIEADILTDDYLLEEVLADSYAGIDYLEDVDITAFSETVRSATEERINSERGPPVGAAQKSVANKGNRVYTTNERTNFDRTSRKKINDDKYWHTGFSKSLVMRVESWVKHDAKTNTNSITDAANWAISKFDGVPVFAIYSTEDVENPTVLYASKGELAEFEKNYLSDYLEDIHHDRRSKDISALSTRGRMLRSGHLVDDDGSLGRESNDRNDTILRRQSRRKPSAAFRSVIQNLLEVSDGGRVGQGENNKNVKFSMHASVEETKDLVAIHNLTERNLSDALDLGGLPMPSIAIVKADAGHSKYGPISLVFGKDTIDPGYNYLNKVYGGDAYTPTAPKIEYEANESVSRKIRDKFYALERQYGRETVDALYGYANYLDDMLDRNGGARGIIDKESDNTDMMKVFLADTGKEIPEPVYTETHTRLDDDTVSFYERIIKNIGKEGLDELAAPTTIASIMDHRKKWLKKYGDQLESTYREHLENSGMLTAEEIDNEMSVTSRMGLIRAANGARKYAASGPVTVTKFYDVAASKEAIRKKVNKKAYSAWLDDLFAKSEKRKGIYNGKEIYTSSGNMKSWNALHYDYTLDNIVRAMKQGQEERGGQTFGVSAGSLQSVTTPEFKTVSEIKQNSGRLAKVDDSEYENLKQSIDEDLSDVLNTIYNSTKHYNDNQFMEFDSIAEAILNAARSSDTPASVVNSFKRDGYKISTDVAQKLLDLYRRSAELPTEYFEAKPQRSVMFDEVLAVVAPRNINASLKQRLSENGINVITYKTDDEMDRLKKINRVDDARFSIRNRTSVFPAGEETRAREVSVPTKIGEKSVSQTIRTVEEAEVTPDNLVPKLDELLNDGSFTYDRYADKAAIAQADDFIKREGYDRALKSWLGTVNSGLVSKTNTARGWALYNAAATAGDMEDAVDILNAIVAHQRNAAQAVQATRILKKLSPDAQLYAATRSVQSLNDELHEKYGDKVPNLKLDEDLARDFLEAETDDARAEALRRIYQDIGKQMPNTFMDKFNAWRYLAMLGNPRTHIRNIVGNAGFAPSVILKDVLATSAESIFLRKGNRTKAFLTLKDGDLIKAAWSDWNNAKDSALGSGKYTESSAMRDEIQNGRIIFGTSKLKAWNKTGGAALETARRFNGMALDAEDQWFSHPYYATALAQYCKANKISADMIRQGGNFMARARNYAIKEAQKATYRDTNAFSEMVSRIGRYHGDNKFAKHGSRLIEGVLPFRKTPANILVRAVEYSPANLFYQISKGIYDVQNGTKTTAEWIDSLCSGLSGTALVGLGMLLSKLGLVSGGGSDDKKKQKFDDLIGHQNYSMEIGDTSVTLDWLAPEALPFFVGVNLQERIADRGDESLKMADYMKAVSGVTEPLLEMSCLQSLNDLFDSIAYNDSDALTTVVRSAAVSFGTQIFPTLAGQIERTTESERMMTYTDKNRFLSTDFQYTLGKVTGKLPGDYSQIPYIDMWGRTERTGNAAARIANNLINPAYMSEIKQSDMENELARLYDDTGDSSVLPSAAPKYFNVEKQRYDLTAKQYTLYATSKGQTAYNALVKMTSSKEYQNLPDDKKVKAIGYVYDYANQTAKEKVVADTFEKEYVNGVLVKKEYAIDKWVADAKKVGIEIYAIGKAATSDTDGIKDSDDETIPNSKGLLIMESLWENKDVYTLPENKRRALFESYGVSPKISGLNKAAVKEKLAKIRRG